MRARQKGTGLAGDEQDAFVASCADLGHEALRHDGPRAIVGQRFDDDVAVRVVAMDAENLAAAHAVERLEDDVALLVDEAVQLADVAECYGRWAKNGQIPAIASFSE
jgi:hypothetical protein